MVSHLCSHRTCLSDPVRLPGQVADEMGGEGLNSRQALALPHDPRPQGEAGWLKDLSTGQPSGTPRLGLAPLKGPPAQLLAQQGPQARASAGKKPRNSLVCAGSEHGCRSCPKVYAQS